MSDKKYKVPIHNLFCVLCYAYEMPEFVSAFKNEDEDLPNLNLLIDLFVKETDKIMKRGLIRGYNHYTQETSQLSGRILFEQSLNHIIQKRPVLICEKDEFDQDILINQVLKVTLETLLKVKYLPKKQKTKIYMQLNKLRHVSHVKLFRKTFSLIRLSRNESYYQKMLLLARFIFELRNLSDKDGSFNMIAVLNDDKKMQYIFEKFILNFYRFEQYQFLSKVERMKWKMFDGNLGILPKMKTDISLIDRVNKQKIIIDAKYYADIFLKSFNADKIRSTHLYQLFTYLNHSSDVHLTRGILVYPTNGLEVDEIYTVPIQVGLEIQISTIRIFTLNLNRKWSKIHEQMLGLLES
ncbi:hypothetical protein C2I27_15220 [Priestia megaterium]|uniref:5-methylcytosine restriction system specificity protein McrC n=1 Tax=Priestia megaterium TaxID=1404 RepID=UPI000D508188|nr:hypothetical protein [Priestia megaterium]PVC67979.1 hypothetical protein C2I27_15220 [Priestia megaterium]